MAGFDPKAYRAGQSQQFSGTPAPVQAPAQDRSATETLFEPFQEAGFITTDREQKEKQSFARRVGEDALLLGLSPSAVVATGVDLATNPIETGKETLEGFVNGYISMVDGREWKEHPLLNTVNTVLNISVVGSLVKSLIMRGARNTVINTAKSSALNAGLDRAVVDTVFSKGRIMSNAVKEGERLNSPEPVIGALKSYYTKAGMTPENAAVLAQDVGTRAFGTWLTENAPKLKKVNAVAHPVAALGNSAKLVSRPTAETIFGRPEQSGVGKLYGSDVVRQDVEGFALVEEWASNQVIESGLKDTPINRARKIQDWVDENPEYASLTPLERNRHFVEYAKADIARKKFAEARGNEYVLTKALPKNYIDALTDFIEKAPKFDADGKPLTNGKIIEELEKAYGKDFQMHSQEVRNRMKGSLETENRELLLKSVKVLGDSRVPISLRALTKEEAKFVAELEGTGYRIGRAPAKTKISQAVEVTGQKFSREDLIAERSFLGRMIDRFGLSPEGLVEGSQFFQFRETFIQKLIEKYGYAKNIEIGGTKYPVRSLHNTLDTLRKIQQQNSSGIFPYKYSIADLREGDLVKMGFSEKDAAAIDKLIRESIVRDPRITGLGEALANYLRSRDSKWYNAYLPSLYEKFLRVQSDLRFKKNPMFAFQAAVESLTWGALFTKQIPGKEFLGKYLNRVRGLERPIIDTLGEPTMQQQAMVLEEVMANYARQLRDGSAPEIYRGMTTIPKFTKSGVEGFAERARFAAQTSDSNIWLGAAGFSNVKIATNLMKSYAGMFGMTLEEALSFKIVGGKKVFNNPKMVERMQDAAQGIFGYHGSALNSPLIRTLNTIFFPFRFQAKSVIQTAKWLGELSPGARLAVVSQWVASARWLATEEGQEWKNKNRGLFASLFNYTFAYEGLGKTVDAVTKGELFGGNAGLIGGLPFGFLVNIARDLGLVSESEQINTSTGKPFERKVQKDPTSFPAFVKAVENIIISMTPAMPFYTATGGLITTSLNRGVRSFVQQVLAAIAAGVNPDGDVKEKYEDVLKDIRRGEKKVKPEYSI